MTTTDTKERNPAGKALFQFQFGFMMMNCGRLEEANAAFGKVEAFLTQLEKEMDEVVAA